MNTRCSLRELGICFACASMVLFPGCWGGPEAIKVPEIQPSPVSDAILSQYDMDADNQLSLDELASCPSLVDGLKSIDKDGDKRLSRDELIGRLTTWAEGGVAVSYFSCRVLQGGQPVEGAVVKFVPESFLSDVLEPAMGTTSKNGTAQLSIDKSKLPSDLQNYHAVQQGFYRVEITHPTKEIPAKYNTATTLGLEISHEKPQNFVTFKL